MSLSWLTKTLLQTGLLARCSVVSRNSPHQGKSNHQNETSLVVKSLTYLPYELRVVLRKHLTRKTCFLLVLTPARKVSDLHGVSYQIPHLKSWRPCSFSFILDLCPRPRTPQFMMSDLWSLLFCLWLTFWMESETKCCSVPSHQLRSIIAGLSSTL